MVLIAFTAGLAVMGLALTARLLIDGNPLFIMPLLSAGVCAIAAIPPATPPVSFACIICGFAIAMPAGFLYRRKTGWILFVVAEILAIVGGMLNTA